MMRGARRATVLRRAVGDAGPATLALALLVCGCVFAAMAGPALSLHARSQALQQTMATLAPTVKTVQVNAVWSNFMDELIDYGGSGQIMTKSQLTGSSRELKASLAAIPLRLGGDDWTSISTQTFPVASGAAPRSFLSSRPPQLEVLYREPFAANIALVSGSYSYPGRTEPAGTVAVALTSQTAARFGLHPGSRLTLSTVTSTVTLVVTAIVRPRGAGSTFWTQDPLAAQPSLVTPPTRTGLTAATSRVRFVVTAIVRPRGARHPASCRPVLGRGGVRGSGPAGRDADRVQQLQHGTDVGVPARARRPHRRPGPGAVQRPEPGHHGDARTDRVPAARRGHADRHLVADPRPVGVPEHPVGHRDRGAAAVGQPAGDRRGRDPACRHDDRDPPSRGTVGAARQGRVTAAGYRLDDPRRHGRRRSRRGGRRRGCHRRDPRGRGVVGTGLGAGRDHARGRVDRARR